MIKFCQMFVTEKMQNFFKKRNIRRSNLDKSTFGLIFHLVVCLHHGYVTLWLHRNRDMSNVRDQRVLDLEIFTPIYFTTWNFLIQSIYFIAALSYDGLHILSIGQEFQEKIVKYNGYIFNSFLFPFSIFVSAMFWTLYNIDRELVLPEVVDKYFPQWLNHCMHTNVLIFTAIEVFITNHVLPTSKSAFCGLTVVVIIYHILFFLAYFVSGRWAYGIFHVLTWSERVAFVLSYYLFTVWMMQIGMLIQNSKNSSSAGKCLKD